MRAAILDLGTNTFHLLIADIGADRYPVTVYQETIAVKLGEGGISEGMISSQAFERGLQAIRKFRALIDTYRPDHIRALATSAIRTAGNGNDFVGKVMLETGIRIEVINGDQEAELIYQAIKAAIVLDQNTLIMDIGGGSVEFIIGNDQEIRWKESYPAGAARLMDRFHHSDPIAKNEVAGLITYLNDTFEGLKKQLNKHKPRLMIGSAGAFETFATLQDPFYKISFEKPVYTLNLTAFKKNYDMLIASTHEERSRMKAILPVRTDMIVAASVITNYVLDISGIQMMKLSSYSLKEGLLFSLIPS
jgi:exopolyphosphatase/guanosine-5'-triphosphate,3'-diphosphate pyrophosphatase